MDAALSSIYRFALWGLVFALFLLFNTAGNRVMAVTMSDTSVVEVASTGMATDTPGSNPGMGQCAKMANCTTHVGGHCPIVDLKRCELIISNQPVEGKILSANTNTVANINFPTGLFRPPIV